MVPPPAPPPPGPPPAAGDVTAPLVTLFGPATQKLGTNVTVGVSCNETCSARASATVRVPAVRRVKAKTYTLAPVTRASIASGARVTVALRLSAGARTAIRRALRARKRVSAAVSVTATDIAGNATTRTRRIRLQR